MGLLTGGVASGAGSNFGSSGFPTGTASAMAGAAAGAPPPASALGDHHGTALALLAASFGVFPDLWLDPDAPAAFEARPWVEALISRTVMSEVGSGVLGCLRV
eukprot:175303-Chlamydomonas_euryale.AAC.2